MTDDRTRGRTRIWVSIAVVVCTAAPAIASADTTSAEAIGAVNALRAANGLPAAIAENAEWSRGCVLHDAYRRTNGPAATGHEEDPALSGYTAEGAQAGMSSVLAGESWSAGNPFEDAPIHLMQLMAPRITAMGADDSGGLVCMTTFRGYGPAAAADTLYSVPGDGREDVPAAQTASELPFVPGALLIPAAAAVTGPHLLVLADGPFAEVGGMRIADASLIGPSGPVAVRVVDQTDERIAGYIPPGGIVIPDAPLTGGTLYTAAVTVEGAAGVRIGRTWSFRTAGPRAAPPPAAATAKSKAAAPTGRVVLRVAVRGTRLVIRGPRLLRNRVARVAIVRPGSVRHRAVTLRPAATLRLRAGERRPGTRISVATAGFVARGVRWTVRPVRTTVARARLRA